MHARHDNTISIEQIMLVYCIIEEILVNIGKIISEHIVAWVKHPSGARPFPHLIENLCLKACLTLDKLPQNKVKLKCLKTKQDGKSDVKKVDGKDEEEKEKDDVPLKRKRQGGEEASRSKRIKSSKAKNSKETLPPASTKSYKKKEAHQSSFTHTISVPHVSQSFERPLMRFDPDVREARNREPPPPPSQPSQQP
ncbi:hypothetical protein E6C27_scaffold137G001110 [Cucumis melo var. makuwa]|uniref:Uncharacterized protein n=1 Tax=Cucumis melo var. makuwa TaxID=1194695 RepID=A0A5A7UY17_CUCMM|nr:hypothetical protein E6C27_scaffold137G001110 [Cucumis melo var. makuwa]